MRSCPAMALCCPKPELADGLTYAVLSAVLLKVFEAETQRWASLDTI